MNLIYLAALVVGCVHLNARHRRRIARWDRRAVCRPVATLAERGWRK